MIATIIIICLSFGGIVLSAAKHGQNRNDKYNIWNSIIVFLINITLFYFAGLFDKF